MTSTSIPQIQCPSCGELNPTDSRFCRHCGTALEGKPAENRTADIKADTNSEAKAESKPESRIEAHAPLVTPLHVPPAPQHSASYNAEDDERSSPGEIDARRARQLLDRSLYLSERGDAAGAILACRQSVALAPTAPGGYSMLGLLLERTGDLPRAITAYEKAVQLAPNSTLERESLDRLREKVQGQKGTNLFHFDDAELFGEEKPKETPTPAIVAPVVVATELDEAPLPNISAAAPGLPASFTMPAETKADNGAKTVAAETTTFDIPAGLAESLTAQLSAITPPLAPAPAIPERRKKEDRRQHAIPVVTERRFSQERRTVPVASSVRSASPINAAPIYIAGLDNGAHRPASTWGALWQRPSFYGRTLPLMGTTVLCLGFLLWARGWAVARASAASVDSPSAPTQIASNPTIEVIPGNGTSNNPNVGTLPALSPVGNNANSGNGFPISNGTNASGTTNPNNAVNGGNRPVGSNVTPGVVGGGDNTPRLTTVPRTSPSFPKMIPPAPIPDSALNPATPSRNNSSNGGVSLPSPDIPQPRPADQPVSVLPADGSTPPLNPAGSSGRGYVRITQGRIGTSALPQRPGAQANDNERDAANAARAGQSDQAIRQLSSAIDADASDAGFRFQQRATLFLERGDYSRAAQDFQSAISAYNAQILRNEQVAAARAGLRAAQSGLNLALAGRR